MKYLFTLIVFTIMLISFGQVKDTMQESINNKLMEFLKEEDIDKCVDGDLPNFRLTNLEGNIVDSETLKGKPTIINFWFTTCAPCIEEIPLLNQIESEYKKEVNFVAITFQDSNTVSPFLENMDFNFLHLVNSKEYLKTFGFFAYPKILILNKNLRIIKIENGLMSKTQGIRDHSSTEFKNNIEALLNTLL